MCFQLSAYDRVLRFDRAFSTKPLPLGNIWHTVTVYIETEAQFRRDYQRSRAAREDDYVP